MVDIYSNEMHDLVATLKSSASAYDNDSFEDGLPSVLSASSLLEAGFRKRHVENRPVIQKTAIPVRNLGSNLGVPEFSKRGDNLGDMKPINLAIWLLIEQAQPGDTVWIRNKALFSNMLEDSMSAVHILGTHGKVWSWVKIAARKRVTVKFLFLEETLQASEPAKLKFVANTFARSVFSGRLGNWTANEQDEVKALLQVRKIVYDKTQTVATVPIICDHGKVYALEKANGKILVGVGTWNADAQSLAGSNENMLFFDEDGGARGTVGALGSEIFSSFLRDVWLRSQPLTLEF
jgi:hypothetical protein